MGSFHPVERQRNVITCCKAIATASQAMIQCLSEPVSSKIGGSFASLAFQCVEMVGVACCLYQIDADVMAGNVVPACIRQQWVSPTRTFDG